jgi:hypothetical protein
MKIADLAPSRIDSDALKRPANEDSPSGAALYKLISRRPSAKIPLIAGGVALLLVGAEAAYFWGLYGARDLATLSPHEWGFLALAFALPLFLIGAVSYMAWRAQEMRLMADALAQTAIRLSDPQDFTAGQVASLTQSITAEIARVQKGFEAAIEQATKLNALVSTDLEEIERGTSRAETRARDMEELLSRHKQGLTEIAQTLGRESDSVARAVRDSVDAVRSLTGEAEHTLQSASTRMLEQTETLSRVSEATFATADATTSMLDRQSSRLEVVATNALSKADAIGLRYETQRQLIAEAAERLEGEHKRLDTIFTMHRDEMHKADAAMALRTADISNAAAELAVRLEATFEGATARASDLRHSIKVEVAQAANEIEQVSSAVSRSAGAATRAIGATVDELKSASTVLNEDVTRLTETIAMDVSARIDSLRDTINASAEDNDKAADRFNAAMIRLGGAAKEAGRYMREATDDVSARMAELPEEAVQSAGALKTALEEHISALAAIAEIVVDHSRTLDRSSRSEQPKSVPSLPPFSARPAPAPQTPLPQATQHAHTQQAYERAEANRRWGIPELLAAAGRTADEPRQTPQDAERDFQRGALHIIETLQALSIDLNRALENSPPPELWRRYQAGERNVFARRLYSMAGRELYDRIAARHRTDGEFREQVDNFTSMFERLMTEAAGRDRDNILVETYLTSDTGKVYLMLAQATGKLA